MFFYIIIPLFQFVENLNLLSSNWKPVWFVGCYNVEWRTSAAYLKVMALEFGPW